MEIVYLQRKKSIKLNKNMQNKPNLGQSQISYKPNENNKLQRKIEIGHLVKTNPNKANFTPPVRHSFSDGGSAVEGSIV
jgi:hypothetical protein